MNVLPFHPDPRPLAIFEGFFLGAAALAIGFAFRRVVDRYLGGDPRRQLIAQAVLYGGTFVVIALSLLLRRRGS
jgi:hypothetical protein